MRLLICAGGTGGGVYPALTVLTRLKADGQETVAGNHPPAALEAALWVGSKDGMEADLIGREGGIPFEAIPAAGVVGVGKDLPANLWRLGQGFLASRRILRRFRPDSLLFTGGYLAVPMALAARVPGLRMRRPRILLYVPDIEPGLALKSLTRFADRVAVTVEDSRAYFSDQGRVTVTGYPTRPALQAWAGQDRTAARQALGLERRPLPAHDLPVLLVTGGSRGARAINRAVLQALPDLLADIQVVHITGNLDWPEMEAAWKSLSGSLPEERARRYHSYPYLHEELGAALAAADLVLSRAGASTLGEYPLFGLPAILAPYPHAWRYQQVNARYLERHGAAVSLQDADLPTQLVPVVRRLLSDRPGLEKMRTAMRALARPQAATAIAELLVRLSQPDGGKHG